MDCSLPGSSLHGILQARILEWVAMPFSKGILLTQGSNTDVLHCRQILYHLSQFGKYCTFVDNQTLRNLGCVLNLTNQETED